MAARLKKDDFVQVMTGKDKGKTGKILKMFPKEGMCIVEKVGLVKRHQKAKPNGGPAGIVEKASKIHLSKVMPVDSKTKEPSRVRMVIEDGKKIRQYVVSGEKI
ncbi:MAG: ribosomal protein [Bacteriovoracaceae bacterium]|nr:ribosomal protein [Bacteriovoracaceae bacterium]